MSDQDLPRLTVIIGPTASGKTDAAIALAEKQGGAVVSADSRQIYAGMNIGTAKPMEAWTSKVHDVLTPDSVQNINHFLFNISTPDHPLFLAQWQPDAFQVIDEIIAQSKHPILTGGTMLYVDSIVDNYSIPNVAPDYALRGKLARQSTADLYATLLAKDQAAKEFIEPHHAQRIIRALEVIAVSGQAFSATRQRQASRYACEVIGLFPGWDELRKRITFRSKGMVEIGLLEETDFLRKQFGAELPLLKTLNYNQAGRVLDGEISREEAVQLMIQQDMRYAHRQMSWWKRRLDITWHP